MNCPKCSRQLGCSCQLRKDPVTQQVIGCSICLQGRNASHVSLDAPGSTQPIPRSNIAPVVNGAYWTRNRLH